MAPFQPTRRRLMQALGGAGVLALLGCQRQTAQSSREQETTAMVTLYTFGDSILDCGRYNAHGVHPGQLLVQNDDRLFPEFAGQDLVSRGSARLEHRARDGATVEGLPFQTQRLQVEGQSIALLTVGGNDLLQGLIGDTGAGITAFAIALDTFVRQLPIRPVLLGNVYDPTFGDDKLNFVGVDPAIARKNLQQINTAIATIANRYGQLVDLHAHFLKGAPNWFTATIEPSLQGASEVRRAFLPAVLSHL